MNTKLTLSIEKTTIEKAKLLSAQTGKSLSQMVEDYLNSITENRSLPSKQLSGLLKNAIGEPISWQGEKQQYLAKKLGLSSSC